MDGARSGPPASMPGFPVPPSSLAPVPPSGAGKPPPSAHPPVTLASLTDASIFAPALITTLSGEAFCPTKHPEASNACRLSVMAASPAGRSGNCTSRWSDPEGGNGLGTDRWMPLGPDKTSFVAAGGGELASGLMVRDRSPLPGEAEHATTAAPTRKNETHRRRTRELRIAPPNHRTVTWPLLWVEAG